MCDNITEYTQIIHVEFNNKIIPIRIYNIKYLIIDLLRILFDTAPWLDIKYDKRIIRLAILMSLYHEQVVNDTQEYGIGLFMIFNILHIIYYFDEKDNDISKNILIFQNIIMENLTFYGTKLLNKTFVYKIIFGVYGYDDIKYLMNEYLYKNKPNEFLCYILLLFIRKILIESDEEWYIKIIKTPDLFPYINFFEIKLLLIKLLKIYIFHIINTTLILTDLKIVLIRFFGNELIEQIKEDLQKNIQNGGISQLENVQTFNKQFNEPVYKLVQLEKFKHFEEFLRLYHHQREAFHSAVYRE
jgi:hypothetical protein